MMIAKKSILFIAAVLLVTPALSKPKQYQPAGCHCVCDFPSGGNVMITYNYPVALCGSYNGKTCNVEDPGTGGVRSGTLDLCGWVGSSEEGSSSPKGGKPKPRLPAVKPGNIAQ